MIKLEEYIDLPRYDALMKKDMESWEAEGSYTFPDREHIYVIEDQNGEIGHNAIKCELKLLPDEQLGPLLLEHDAQLLGMSIERIKLFQSIFNEAWIIGDALQQHHKFLPDLCAIQKALYQIKTK